MINKIMTKINNILLTLLDILFFLTIGFIIGFLLVLSLSPIGFLYFWYTDNLDIFYNFIGNLFVKTYIAILTLIITGIFFTGDKNE